MNHRNYGRDADGAPLFRRSLVLFLDLLGTSEMANSPRAEQYLRTLDAALAPAREQSRDTLEGPWFFASWFSDNLALAAPVVSSHGEDELMVFVSTIARIQLTLALEGFASRGAVTIGKHFQDGEVSFGPALVTAVNLERAVAMFPRVVLSDEVSQLGRTHLAYYSTRPETAPQNLYLLVDESGVCFVNYLRALGDYVDESIHEAAELVARHRDHVARSLTDARENPNRWAKWMWTANYHNWFCREENLGDSLMVDTPTFGVSLQTFAEWGANLEPSPHRRHLEHRQSPPSGNEQ